MKKTIVVCCLLFGAGFSFSAAAAQTPQQIVEKFLSGIQKGKISESYDELFKGSNILTAKPQAVTTLKHQTKTGLPLYGKVLGFEKIHNEQLSKSLARLVYVLKVERHPTIWQFYFYKPYDQWVLINVKFNDQYDLLGALK